MKSFLRILLGAVAGILATSIGIFLYGRAANARTEPVPELPPGPAAVITHVVGPVFVIRDDSTLDAAPGDRLVPGDVVKVTEGAVAQVQMADKGSALLGGDTLVRFLKLTGADRQLEMRTEILTGSLSYIVNKLAGSESVVIQSGGSEFEVRGTEFLIVKSSSGTILAVSEGMVRVTGNVSGDSVEVAADKQLEIPADGGAAVPEDLTEENRARLASSRPMQSMPFGFPDAPGPVRVEIAVRPPDADIYIDGLKTGRGRFRSLLPQGTVINVRVRRRGFKDSSRKVVAAKDQFIEINMEPTGVDETLAEEKAADPLWTRLKEGYERRLADLRSLVAKREAENAAEQAKLAAERTRMAEEEARRAAEQARREAAAAAALEKERGQKEAIQADLEASQAENQNLQNLIRQIQELTD